MGTGLQSAEIIIKVLDRLFLHSSFLSAIFFSDCCYLNPSSPLAFFRAWIQFLCIMSWQFSMSLSCFVANDMAIRDIRECIEIDE